MTERDKTALYAEAGEALFLGQVLELNIAVLIDLLNRGYNAHIEPRQIVIDGDKKTLGQLINLLKKRGSASPETEEALATALAARNYIVHEIFIRAINCFADDEAYEAALALARAKGKEIAIGTAITQGFVQGFTEHLGHQLTDVLIRQDV